jgi:hypothetical protein
VGDCHLSAVIRHSGFAVDFSMPDVAPNDDTSARVIQKVHFGEIVDARGGLWGSGTAVYESNHGR